MFEDVGENPKHPPGSRVLNPAIGADSANALFRSQGEKLGCGRIQMARVMIHESPLLFARYRHARVHPAQRSESAVVYFTRSHGVSSEIADALEADLQPLASSGLIARISKYDTNPANNPQPPARERG